MDVHYKTFESSQHLIDQMTIRATNMHGTPKVKRNTAILYFKTVHPYKINTELLHH